MFRKQGSAVGVTSHGQDPFVQELAPALVAAARQLRDGTCRFIHVYFRVSNYGLGSAIPRLHDRSNKPDQIRSSRLTGTLCCSKYENW